MSCSKKPSGGSSRYRKLIQKHLLSAQLFAVLTAGLLNQPALAQAPEPAPTSTANGTSVHPERGGLMLDTSERRSKLFPLQSAPLPFAIDPRLSIFVTDRKSVEQLSFAEVLQQLVDQGGDPNLTKEQLFARWWDSANLSPTPPPASSDPTFGAKNHCDDEINQPTPAAPRDAVRDLSTLNQFPYRCPRPEGKEAKNNPFDPTSDTGYIAIAYSNRFDLADPSGRDCGQYRVVFARVSGTKPITSDPSNGPLQRNLIIFEAHVKNPTPPVNVAVNPAFPPNANPVNDPGILQNLIGCKPIIDFWASLSDPSMSTQDRGKKLKDFYLKGLPGFGPTIHVDNFRGDGNGQIRTNQFLDHGSNGPPADAAKANFDWTLREFKVGRVDPANPSTVFIVPQTVKSNPGTALFDPKTKDFRSADFYDVVIGQLGPLLGGEGGIGNIDTFSYNNPDPFNSFESDEGSHPVFSLNGNLGSVFDQFTAERGGSLFRRLSSELAKHNPTLTPDQVVARLQTQTCSGCHQFSNKGNILNPNPANDLGGGLNWTQSLGFTQESERALEAGPDGNGTRYLISDLLKDIFLPERLLVMTKFLAVNQPGAGGDDGCHHCYHHHHDR
jgi:hypothetical protein